MVTVSTDRSKLDQTAQNWVEAIFTQTIGNIQTDTTLCACSDLDVFVHSHDLLHPSQRHFRCPPSLLKSQTKYGTRYTWCMLQCMCTCMHYRMYVLWDLQSMYVHCATPKRDSTDRQMHTDRQTDRKKGGQTDRHTIHTYVCTHTYMYTYVHEMDPCCLFLYSGHARR